MKFKTENFVSDKGTGLSLQTKAVIYKETALHKETSLNDVPDAFYRVILGYLHNESNARYLDNEEQGAFCQLSKRIFFATKPSNDMRILKRFLECVAYRKQSKVEALLKSSNPSQWLLGVGKFTDCAGRTFRCSAYEYAYWAKDTIMRRVLEKYMDDTTKHTILQRIIEMERIDKDTGKAIGLTYIQDNKEYRSAHIDLTSFKQVMNAYRKGYDKWNGSRVMKARMDIAKELRNLPIHMVNDERCFRSFAAYDSPLCQRDLDPMVAMRFRYDIITFESWSPFVPADYRFGFNSSKIIREDLKVRQLGGPKYMLHVNTSAIIMLDDERTAELRQSRDDLNTLTTSLTQLSHIL